MTQEEKARHQIDAQLTASGWAVQSRDRINLSAQRGVAVCELSFKTGEPDYTLFVDGKAIGTVEAKPAGVTLTSVEEQSAKYVTGVPFGLPAWKSPLAFCYESTGAETFFTNRLDPQPRSRRVFSFHCPQTLLAWVQLSTSSPIHQQHKEDACPTSPAGRADADFGGIGAAVERGGGAGVGGVGQPPARHPPPPVHPPKAFTGELVSLGSPG